MNLLRRYRACWVLFETFLTSPFKPLFGFGARFTSYSNFCFLSISALKIEPQSWTSSLSLSAKQTNKHTLLTSSESDSLVPPLKLAVIPDLFPLLSYAFPPLKSAVIPDLFPPLYRLYSTYLRFVRLRCCVTFLLLYETDLISNTSIRRPLN